MAATIVFKKGNTSVSKNFSSLNSQIHPLFGKIVTDPKIVDGMGDRKVIIDGKIVLYSEIICLQWNDSEKKKAELTWLSGEESYVVQSIVSDLESRVENSGI